MYYLTLLITSFMLFMSYPDNEECITLPLLVIALLLITGSLYRE